jgi:hypothetical protein
MTELHLFANDFKITNIVFEEILNTILGPVIKDDLRVMGILFIPFADPTKPLKQVVSSILLAIHVGSCWNVKKLQSKTLSFNERMGLVKHQRKIHFACFP